MSQEYFIKQYDSKIAKDMDECLLRVLKSQNLVPSLLGCSEKISHLQLLQGSTLYELLTNNAQCTLDVRIEIFTLLIDWLNTFQEITSVAFGFPVKLTNFYFKNFIYCNKQIYGFDFEEWEKGTDTANDVSMLAWLKIYTLDSDHKNLIFQTCAKNISLLLNVTPSTLLQMIENEVVQIQMRRKIKKRMEKSDAFIITGGKSSRMGTPKQKLYIGRYTFLEHLQHTLRRFDSIGLSIGSSFNTPTDIKCHIPDIIADIGPLGGIYSLLSYTAKESIFIVPCDMPSIGQTIMDSLYMNMTDSDDCVIARIDGRIHPLIGIYKKRILPTISRQIENKDYKIMNLLNSLTANHVDIIASGNHSFENINDKTTFQKTLEHLDPANYPYTTFI